MNAVSGPVPPPLTPAQRAYLRVFDDWMRAGAEEAPDFMHDRKEAAAARVSSAPRGTRLDGTTRLLAALGFLRV